MNKVWLGAAAGLGGCCLLMVLLSSNLSGAFRDMTKSSVAFVDAKFPAIFTTFDTALVKAIAAPKMASAQDPSLEESMAGLRAALGPMKTYSGSTFIRLAKLDSSGQNGTMLAVLRVKASFEKREAEFEIRLLRVGKGWQLAAMEVGSPRAPR